MRFPYTTTHPLQNNLDSLPRLPMTLINQQRRVEALGLVDSGATINVLPYQIGIQLGASWDASRASIATFCGEPV